MLYYHQIYIGLSISLTINITIKDPKPLTTDLILSHNASLFHCVNKTLRNFSGIIKQGRSLTFYNRKHSKIFIPS